MTAKTKVLRGGPILKSNRFFIKLTEYGHCDDKGKTIMGVGLSAKKLQAEPDRPICSLFLPMLMMLMNATRYSNDEAMAADLKEFQKAVAQWRIVKKK